jgi:hypothetical protein
MSVATYTQQIIGQLDRTGEARLPFSSKVEASRMRSRLANAARRSGLIITTTTEDGYIVGTVLGWR